MANNTDDLEKGFGTSQFSNNNQQSNAPPPAVLNPRQTRPSTVALSEQHHGSQRADIDASDTTRSPLSDFRFAVGIYNDHSLSDVSLRVAENRGLYQRVVKAEKQSNKQYRIFAILINGALGLQIVFAAALTALGASGAQVSKAVTAFGAMNTILAGFLTFLKGSGLPNRLKYYHNEWSRVREYIEQRERDFARGLEDLNLSEEVAVIERMYETVRKDVETNTPDSYISIGTSRHAGAGVHPSLARHLEKRALVAEEKMSRKIEETANGIEGKVRGTEDKLVSEVKEKAMDTEDKLMAMAERAAEKVLDFTRRHD